ncbi:MAG: DNA primase [Patescibacteria group bacterium]|nr:DNA primase [Patescibacteria group bacterium]MDD4610447.1 DNA primase [Patescibacteria group bacterium]
MNSSDEIKSKLDIVDIIRDYIPLKAAGVNFRANCPFHHEKSPSFIVSPEKQIWHCFGCGKGGDVISFVMDIEGLSFIEALRMLAPKAGITLVRQNPELTSKRNRLLDILEISVKYYHKILLSNAQAGAAKEYLAKRGLSDNTIDEWQIGYSPDSWDDLIILLKSRGFTDNEIFLAGMSVKKEGMGRFYNRFRDRIMFPIFDINGAPVAFSARVNPAKEATEKMGKYINSPQTMVYDKSKILFGLDKAKMAIKANNLAIIVEGQMDAITAHQNGFKNIIASSGTALTGEQINLIKRYTDNIALAFDADTAGELAADRGIREAMAKEMNIKVIEVPLGKDPDECIKSNPTEWKKAVTAAKPMMQYYFDKIFANLDLSTVDNRRETAKKLLPTIFKLGNAIEKDYWLKKLSAKIDVEENILRETLQKMKATKQEAEYKKAPDRASREIVQTRQEMLSELLIALILKFPILFSYVLDHLIPEQIAGDGNQRLYKELIIYYNNITVSLFEGEAMDFNYQELSNWLKEKEIGQISVINSDELRPQSELVNLLDRLMLLADRDFYNFDNEQAKNEIIRIIVFLKKQYLTNRMKELEKLISEAEKNNDKANIVSLMEELKLIFEEIKELS